MRLGIFSKRRRGAAATTENWVERDLPTAEVRVAFAAIEKSDRFGARWGVGPSDWEYKIRRRFRCWPTEPAGFGKKAPCTWREPARSWTSIMGWNIWERRPKCSTGEGTEGAKGWIAQGCKALLSGGWSAIHQHLKETKETTRKRSHRASLNKLSGYLYRNSSRLGYAQQLAEGRAIGSGQAEGACKHMIGRRLKQTAARWRVRRVNRMAVLCCLLYS